MGRIEEFFTPILAFPVEGEGIFLATLTLTLSPGRGDYHPAPAPLNSCLRRNDERVGRRDDDWES